VNTDDLTGRVVIIPRADTVAGAEVARVMCAAGAAAILTGSQFSALGNVAAEIHGETGAPIAIFAGDLTREDERTVLAEMVSELFPQN
jgi:NAD(P)-dependent dehydrogenase (short-subunit alcohol dehydrogenase family)